MDRKVTIVIPTFNRAHLVYKTIDSALAQTHPCDIIVCDHGSTDDTPKLMQQYQDKVLYIRREKDFGPHFCWLEGVLHAQTEFVHLHFDDDLLEPNYIEETIKLMNDDVGFCFSNAGFWFHDSSRRELASPFINLKTGIYSNKIIHRLVRRDSFMISPAACLYRKKDMVDALIPGDLPTDFGGRYHGAGPDHFMALITLLRYKKFAVVAKPLVLFGIHKSSISADAEISVEKTLQLSKAYRAWRRYYLLMSLYQNNIIIKSYIMLVAELYKFPGYIKSKVLMKLRNRHPYLDRVIDILKSLKHRIINDPNKLG